MYESRYKIKTKYPLKERLDKYFLHQYEKKCCEYFSKTLFCSEADKKSDHLKNNKKLYVIPNVYDASSLADYDFGSGITNENSFLFVGSLIYGVNIDGLEWFVKEIFKKYKKKYPEATLSVVGKNPKPRVYEITKGDGISLFPDVPDVKPFYAKAKYVVVPILIGGGTRIKILEAALASRTRTLNTNWCLWVGFNR